MDINDYLANMRRDLDSRLQNLRKDNDELLASIINGKTVTDESPAPQETLPSLMNIPGIEYMEDAAKTCIGTFEKLYEKVFEEDTKMPMQGYGFADLGYSSLIIQLSKALEIELQCSLYQLLRGIYGVPMPDYYNKNYNCNDKYKFTYKFDSREVDFWKSECFCILNRLPAILKETNPDKMRLIEHYIDNIDDFIKFLDKTDKKTISINIITNDKNNDPDYIFKRTRNGAAHTQIITKEIFLDFYSGYYKFLNDNLKSLLEIKYDYKDDNKSANTTRQSLSYGYQAATRSCKRGVIFTDTKKLSIKYFGDGKESCNIAERIRENYIIPCSEAGIEYKLLDMSGYVAPQAGSPSWFDCLSVLDAYCTDNGISNDEPYGLFIIGGNDVIPMPSVHNPNSDPSETESPEKDLDADLLYAYSLSHIKFNSTGYLDVVSLLSNKPRFFVGRLPLEDGYLATRIESDLICYFKRAVNAHSSDGNSAAGGIKIQNPVFTTCQRATHVAHDVAGRFPLGRLEDISGFTSHDIITSPNYSIPQNYPTTQNMDADSKYCMQKQLDADMLIFILHGSNGPGNARYAGEASGGSVYPTAFIPDILAHGNALIVAGICCWGARFIGYSREDSALLTAIYHNTLLFTGSCRTAFGGFDENYSIYGRVHVAEMFLKYYLRYLMQGHDAGQAVAAAKAAYFNDYVNADGPNNAATTVLEFNLFGDPLLNVRQVIAQNAAPLSYTSSADCDEIVSTYPIYVRKSSSGSLLDEVRNLVDNNFKYIHDEISEHLYKYYNVNPRSLYSGHGYRTKYGKSGYILRYRTTDERLTSDTIVDTDINGRILNVAMSY